MKIVSLSPTQIESFDDTTPFGCSRRWWFERVGGRDKGPISGGDLGTAVHSTLEAFLLGGPQGGLHDLVIGAPGALEWLLKLRPRIMTIEKKIEIGELALAGIPVTGRIDWVAASETPGVPELGDHKTTSDIARYAKTPTELKNSTQMNIYAATLDVRDRLIITQDFYQTKKKKKFEAVSVETTKPFIDERILSITAIVEKMVKVSQETNPENVTPNEKVCNIGFGCIHRPYCKRSGEFNMASLLDAFSKTPASAPDHPSIALAKSVIASDAANGFPPSPIMTAAVQIALPPDAPASDPALASKPPKAVTETTAIPEKKRRGRPPGAKVQVEVDAFLERTDAPPTTAPVKVDRITIRHGAKVGMPNFSSVLIEVEFGGVVTGSVQDAREALSLQCKTAMTKELEMYTAKAEVKK